LSAWQPAALHPVPVMPITQIVTCYYFRFAVADRPGVLAAIAGILGEYGISIKSVHQKGRKTNGDVPIVMLTHPAREADVQKAFKKIADLDVVASAPVLIRIEQDAADETA
jgi:homoserine dehydrogenase